MTRGYAVLTEGKKIIKATYFPGDAYPSNYGLEVLEAIKKGALGVYIDDQNAENPQQLKECEGICPEWYTRTKENEHEYFDDYVYVHDQKSGVTTVRHYGKQLWKFGMDMLDTYITVFEHDSELWRAYSFDEKTLSYAYAGGKRVAEALRKGVPISEMLSFAANFQPLFIMEKEPYCALGRCFHETDLYMPARTMQRRARGKENERSFEFFLDASSYDSSVDVVFQLPYCRVSMHKATCKTKALGFIRDFVRKNGEGLYVLADIFDLYENTMNALRSMNGMPEKRTQFISEAMVSMGELFSKQTMCIPYFSLDKIKTVFCDHNIFMARKEQELVEVAQEEK